jgi:hypothetical protein
MGGFGAAFLGGRLPGFFGSVGVLSGFVDPQIVPLLISPAMDLLSGTTLGSVLGPESGFYATGHNPTALVDNLQHTRVFMSAGDGFPSQGEGLGGRVGNVEEAAIIRPMSNAYDDALKAARIDVTYETHVGCHCWADFQAELRNAIAWGPFNPVVDDPTAWVNSTVATHGQLWDIRYQFATHPTAVVRFTRTGRRLQISAAGTPATLTTSGGCVLRLATPVTVQIPSKSCETRKQSAAPSPGSAPSPTSLTQPGTPGATSAGIGA